LSINAFPAEIQAIVQNGILDRMYQEALTPALLYRNLATQRPFQANLGEIVTFTRTGLLLPATTPLTVGTDPTAANYTIEQYSMSLNSYGNAMDTNMLSSQIALASKFLEDNQKLAFNAAQSLNHLVRDKLYTAYLSGNTRAVGAGSAATALVVNNVNGFTSQMLAGPDGKYGLPVPVSASNKLPITVNGTAVNVTAVNTGTSTLTLDAAITWADGDPVVATNAPVIVRPGAKTTNQKLTSSDTITLSNFTAAVAKLRQNNVPTVGGYYVAHIDAITEQQLFGDADFKQALQGREDSPVWRDLSIGRFAGIDWVRNTEAPTIAGASGVTVRQPILMGGDCIIEGPLQGYGQLLSSTGVDRPGLVTMVGGIAMIHRPPIDRMQQVIGSAWNWVGDFAIPTDALTGSAATLKRAIVLEHAG
jgi:hypothetical protein